MMTLPAQSEMSGVVHLPNSDHRQLRNALGRFPTGVAIVTTRNSTGYAAGLVINSFTSVSLAPPLVLWSLAHSSSSRDVFSNATHFAIHVLTEDQKHLSARFASSGGDKFAGLSCAKGLADVPLIDEVAARFECSRWSTHDAGDHTIYLGLVQRYSYCDRPPLLYHRGAYAVIHA